MNDFLHMRFFSLLAEPSQEVTNEKMQNAYAQFIVHIETVSNSDDKQIIFRMLNFTRIELSFIESLYQYEQEKKCA